MGPDSQWIHLCALFQNMKQTVLLIIYSLAFIAKDLINRLFFFFFSESWFRLLKGILLVISTEQSEAQYVSCYICCGSLSRLSSNLNEFFICLQVSWNLMCRTEVSVYFHFQIAQAEKEIVMEAKEFNSHLIKDKGNHPQGEHVGILDYWLVFLKESRKKEMFYGFFF